VFLQKHRAEFGQRIREGEAAALAIEDLTAERG
jgi:hypothetical protein